MKNKLFVLGLVLFLAIGLVSAANGEGYKGELQGEPEVTTASLEQGSNGIQPRQGDGEPRMISQGELSLGEGQRLRIQDGEGARILESEGKMAKCEDCQLEQITENGQVKLQAKLSNGKNAEIKVMPHQASERALERLRLKNCPEETCTIELKEVGSGDEAKMAYNVEAKKKAKFLGIFGTDMNVEAQIDAETGEVIKSKKPWWAFMASEQDEEDSDSTLEELPEEPLA